MTLYRAAIGNAGFYIQPDMIKPYHDLGYKIYKMIEVEVPDEDIDAEAAEAKEYERVIQQKMSTLLSETQNTSKVEKE